MPRSVTSALYLAIFVFDAPWAVAAVSPQGITIKGPSSKEAVQKVLQSGASGFQACFDELTGAARKKGGRAVLEWKISPEGRVSAVEYQRARSSLREESFTRCVVAALRSLRFPKPTRGSTEAACRLVFSPYPSKDEDAELRAQPHQDKKAKRREGGGGIGSAPASVSDSLGGVRGTGRGSSAKRAGKARRPSAAKAAPAPPPGSKPKPRTKSPHRDGPLAEIVVSTPAAPRVVSAPAMKAGRHDDNKQYNRFLSFLRENQHYVVYPIDISERLVIQVADQKGKSLPNCQVEVKSLEGKILSKTTTYADGRTMFFPADKAAKGAKEFVTRALCGDQVRNGQLNRAGRRVNEIRFGRERELMAHIPVDIAIVLDTTGSMGSQIDRLKKTLQAIHVQLTVLPTKPDIRFALVAYRDRGDEYVTQVTHFTGDVDLFQQKINRLDADGGGDTPEDLQGGLEKAMQSLKWRQEGLRLGFIVADAIPHTDYGQDYNYREVMRDSLARGTKWTAVGAGGLPRAGEVIFRQIAQYTMGEYVFVTQGAVGDTNGGVGEASHHVGTNYKTENLDQAIVRIVRRELSYLTDRPRDFDYTIIAKGTPKTPRDKVLAPAVAEVLRQLTDYCAIRLEEKTPVAVMPVTNKDPKYNDVAEYLTEQMILSTSRQGELKVVERDLEALAQEHKLQLSALFDVEDTVQIGQLIGAEVLIVSKLTITQGGAELYARLVRVETGEILSAAKVSLSGGII